MDAARLLDLLRRRRLPFLLCLVAGVVGALLLTATSTELYRAESRVFVNVPSASNVQSGVQGLQLTNELLPSYAELASSRLVADRVKTELSLTESVGEIRSALSAEVQPDTLFIQIAAVDEDPEQARRIAEAATTALSEAVAELEEGRPDDVAVELRTIDPATTPSQSFEPRTGYNLALGALLGLFAGVLLALVLEALDRSVKSGAEVARVSGAPLVGMVPRARQDVLALARGGQGDADVAEAFRTMSANVRFLDPENELQVLLVSSPSQGEGRTTVAVDLAASAAAAGVSTIVVDADLRSPGVAAALGVDGSSGVVDIVTGRATLDACLRSGAGRLDVLPAGRSAQDTAEQCGSQRMGELLDELRQRYDLVVLDGPPLLPVADAVVLAASQVDGVLLVARAGSTERAALAEARRRLDTVAASVVGCVVNGVSPGSSPDHYGDDGRSSIAAARSVGASS